MIRGLRDQLKDVLPQRLAQQAQKVA
jgi:hypothetical protein